MKSTHRFAMNATALAVASALANGANAQALPTGFNPTPGTATMSTPTTSSMVVNQTAPRTIIDWTTFNIANGNSLTFTQPSASAVAVNRVGASAGQSAIDGILSANGHVMILNPNGVLFGPTASVNVAGLIASTGNIDASAFLSGATSFAITGATAGSVSNAGTITVANTGLAAFVAPSVANSGVINAASGRIRLGGAQAATISLNGGLYELAITQGVANPSVSSTGTLNAAGGNIVISALDAANVVSGVINLQGIEQADRIEVNGGHVTLASSLNASTVTGISSTIDVGAGAKVQNGIDIAATGATVNVAAGQYAEQLAIGKSISLVGAGASQTTIAPTSLAADADGMRNILTIRGAGTNSEVSGLMFKGPVPAITAGIFVRDGANARIHDNKLVDMRESVALSGNQRGIGIFVGRASLATSGTATIENNQITGYQKGGIVVDGPGSQATIRGNTVTGSGPTAVIAQNGIQVSRGARATLTGNTVQGNAYTGISPDPDDFAAGILYFVSNPYPGQGGLTADSTNSITANQVGIWTNEALVLPTISLAGATGNTRNAVAFFNGGYAGQGPLLEYPAWGASASALVNPTAFTGAQSGDIRNANGTLYVSGWNGFSAVQPAIDAVAVGATVNVAAGTFTQTKTLNVSKSITLAGAGESSTTIDSRTVTSSGGGYALQVTADNVTLRDFTLYGPTVDAGNAYGIKVQPAGSAASSRLHDFSISNVTSRGAGRAELDLNGVVGATIDHVTANGAPVGNDSGTTKGAGIQVTDSTNVTIRNSTTRNNAWGGIALYQSNRFFDQQTSNISVEGNNVLTESLPLYMQDESASRNFGALSLQGFNYAVKNSDSPSTNDQYTWLQYTLGGAYDFAVNTVQPGKSSIQGWNVSALDHNFYVGVGHVIAGGTRAMSVQSAIDAAAAGDLVNVAPGNYTEIASNRTLGPGVGGTYDLGLLLNKDNLTVRGVDAAGNPITSASNVQAWISAGASTNFGMNHGVVADNVTVQGLGFRPYAPAPNKTIEIAGDNFTFRNSVVDNRTADGGAGALYFGELLTNHQIARLNVTGSTFYDGSVSLANGVGVAADGVTFQPTADRVLTNNAFIGSSNYTFGGLLLSGKMDEVPWRPLPIGAAVVTGNSFSGFDESVLVRGEQQGVDLRSIMQSNTFDRAVLVTDASGNVRAGQYVSLNNVTRDKFTIQSSIQAGVDRAQNGDTVAVGAGTYAEDVTVAASRNLTFSGATIHSLTVNANSGIGGTATADGTAGFQFNAPATLLSDTLLSTTGNRNITFSSTIDGASALSLQAGTGTITFGGNVGAITPLASLTANASSIAAQSVSTVGDQSYIGALALNGAGYTASNGAFSGTGATTLNVDTTVGGKNISFSSTVNGAKALSLQAGTGTVTLGGNVGVTSLTANGSAITAQNVSTVGDQTYAGALTLNGGSYTAANGAFNSSGATMLGTDTTVNGQNISFSSAISGAKTLSLLAGTGTVTLGGNVGVSSLTANGSAISAQNVSTTGNQSYTGGLTLNGASYTASSGVFNATGATTLGTDTTVNGQSISFSSTVNGAKALSLQAGTGTVTLGGNVGVTSLTANGSAISAQNVSTTGNQSYTGVLTLNGGSYTASNGAFSVTGATTLAANTTVSGQNISFSSTIDGAKALSLAGTGGITLGGNVSVSSLTATGSTIAAQNVSTTGNQSYTGALTLNGASYTASNGTFGVTGGTTLGANTTVDTSASNRNISFSGTINGARTLSLQAGTGDITLGGDVGGSTRLAGLTATGSTIATHNVSSVGDQSYAGALTFDGASYNASNGSFSVTGATTLSADTTVDTSAGNKDIAFNGDIRTVGNNPYALTLNAGSGNITLTSGGTQDTPLGILTTNSGNFTLLGTLWVSGFGIDALGAVALSNHSLHAVGGGTSDVINAGTGVTGTASSAGDVAIQTGGDVTATVTATNIAINAASVSGTANAVGDVAIQSTGTVAANVSATNIAIGAASGVAGTQTAANGISIQSGGSVTANVSANNIVINAEQVNAVVNSPNAVEIHSPAPVNVSGSAPTLVVDAPGGSVSGNFGQVSNAGSGLIEVNGSHQAPDVIAANVTGVRVLPTDNTITGNSAANPRVSGPDFAPEVSGPGIVRASVVDAGDLLQGGASVELDLSPHKDRE